MTLRDYFAASADVGDVDELNTVGGVRLMGTDCPDSAADWPGHLAWWAEYRAKLRYIEADAMLKARAL